MNKEQQELLTKSLKAFQEIDRTPKVNYIHLSTEYIQSRADENGVTFDDMIVIIKNELNPKQ
jgi:hypothetical protein